MQLNANNTDFKILVVDDVEPVRLQIRDGLALFGPNVITADSGAKALSMFRKEYFDLVICDLGMPDMDGHEVAKEIGGICEHTGLPRPRFVLITGWGALTEHEEEMLKDYVDRVIEKPADIWELWDLVCELLPISDGVSITRC